MKKILVKVPTKREPRFMLMIGGGAKFYRQAASATFHRLESRLLRTRKGIKSRPGSGGVHLYVKYPDGHNDGFYETPKETLYASACFLEDYLPPSFAKRKYKRFMEDYEVAA